MQRFGNLLGKLAFLSGFGGFTACSYLKLRLFAHDEDVRGLDVKMHDAAPMRPQLIAVRGYSPMARNAGLPPQESPGAICLKSGFLAQLSCFVARLGVGVDSALRSPPYS